MTESRRTIGSGAAWEPIVGYSRAVRIGQTVAVAGTTAALPGGGVVGPDDPGEQTREVIRRIEAALVQLGATLNDVVRTRMFVTDIASWEQIGRAHGEFFAAIRPVATMVQVAALIEPQLLVEIEADAVVTGQPDVE
jgi:enamine deaminase RidA (YjgF/YER057c/UK114 family)